MSSAGHSSSPWISSAADCLPRLSPPAASPARMAASRRRGKGRLLLAIQVFAVSSSTSAPASMLPAMEKPLPAICPHQATQSRPVCAAIAPLASMM
jgi:hypothetical protein